MKTTALLATLVLCLIVAPLVSKAQQPTQVHRIVRLTPNPNAVDLSRLF